MFFFVWTSPRTEVFTQTITYITTSVLEFSGNFIFLGGLFSYFYFYLKKETSLFFKKNIRSAFGRTVYRENLKTFKKTLFCGDPGYIFWSQVIKFQLPKVGILSEGPPRIQWPTPRVRMPLAPGVQVPYFFGFTNYEIRIFKEMSRIIRSFFVFFLYELPLKTQKR